MVRAVTENFHEMVLEVETTPGSGIYAKICGLTSRSVNRTSNMQTSEIPDCDDESLPAAVERAVQSQEVTIPANGSWAAQSHGLMMDWWYSGQTKNIRVGHLKAEPGDTEYEAGPAYLVNLNNVAERGTKVTADFEIQFDGLPTRTAAVSS